jgi:hypothetical protein
MAKRRREQRRPCFLVVSWEGCWMEEGPLKGQCRAPHFMVDCQGHGLLAKVHHEETAKLVMAGHLEQPGWPTPMEPVSDAVLARIDASRTRKDQLFVPDTYKG